MEVSSVMRSGLWFPLFDELLSPGTDVSPYAEAGATWWMTELEPGVSLDTVRGVVRDGPAE